MLFAFISRHEPTPEQHALAKEQGIELIYVGDVDAFTVTPGWVWSHDHPFEGVIVVHPAASMRLCSDFLIGVFKNGSRAGIGEKLDFFAEELHIFDMRD